MLKQSAEHSNKSSDKMRSLALHQPNKIHHQVDNPYQDVDREKCHFIPSASHVHIESQEKLDKIYHQFGLRHISISNYYPSAPYYPADKIMQNQ